MATITYRTTDEKKEKLTALASEQHLSVNKVLDELVTIAITERDAFARFQARANRGDAENALNVLKSKALN
ncbi:toxin-antitoxin system HicB family antitoxin [Thalassotalea sp. LPB0316]|uniref:toxin-antitoxin system HicB family antitoxin n=1 Tax=Thalassotalea sp. LPB0316 TaxID=2769490 RepID=UPI001868C213|nr:toxin-antitoxin system HicB family antitoxin [Thalassotalea sp. LPB0316]QOL26944.1 toxin-antitoxin system HicB family antitoxin [Thalassotalea sp. LPB0316]